MHVALEMSKERGVELVVRQLEIFAWNLGEKVELVTEVSDDPTLCQSWAMGCLVRKVPWWKTLIDIIAFKFKFILSLSLIDLKTHCQNYGILGQNTFS